MTLVLLGCSGGNKKEEALGPRTEFAGVRFGASLSEISEILPARLFNSASISSCYTEISTDGCYLFPSEGAEGIYLRRGGVPYGLQLDFDQNDNLESIVLTYKMERAQFDERLCFEAFARTHSWMTSEFGPSVDNPKMNRSPNETEERIAKPDGDSITIRRLEDGGAIELWVFESTADSQSASIALTMLPEVGTCDVRASLSEIGNLR